MFLSTKNIIDYSLLLVIETSFVRGSTIKSSFETNDNGTRQSEPNDTEHDKKEEIKLDLD